MKIIFTDTTKGEIPEIYYPVPADTNIPEWYKKIENYVGGKKSTHSEGKTLGTIKKCMPVFDMITTGYLIVLPSDIIVKQETTESGLSVPFYEWPQFGLIEFHSVEQAPTHPNRGYHETYPKFINPWSIKTPKGYSTLFIQPTHRESVFSILPGVVDTDKYTAPVNFPFILNDINFEGIIPAGTPIAQVIPFKRDSWKMDIGNSKIYEEQKRVGILNTSKIFDSYKTLFRTKKQYK